MCQRLCTIMWNDGKLMLYNLHEFIKYIIIKNLYIYIYI